MTLILAIPTRGPLVFTADKRLTVGANQYDDTTNKLVPIGPTAVGSAFGAVRHLGGNPLEVRFNIYSLMREFFANGFFTVARLGQFNQHIPQQFAQFRATYRNNEVIETLFQAIFYTWQNGSFRFNHVRYWTAADGTLQWTGTNKSCVHGGLHAHGDDAVIAELIAGYNPDFDDLRNDADVQRFVVHRQAQNIEEVEPDDAIAFSQRFIELCHDTYPLLHAAKEPISRGCNIALLHRDRGCEVIV